MSDPFVVITIAGERTTVGADFRPDVVQLPPPVIGPDERAARLDAAKRLRKAEIEAARDAAIFGGMATPAGRVDTNQRSIDIINGYATSAIDAAIADEPFLVSFRLADNREVPVDGPTMRAIKRALDRQVASSYAWSWGAKADVDAALTEAEVAAVSLDVVFPESAND